MAGLVTAIRLRQRGDADFIVYEKGNKVGGTWRENRYPGLTCDVHAHAYTYSFAPYPEWTRFFAAGPEIQHYFEWVTDKFAVRDAIRFNVEVTACVYEQGRWQIELSDGSRDTADVVIAATGVLHHPNIPEIAGIGDFAGPAFHSARWPDELPLAGKRVGVIGSGSTGVQIVCGLSNTVAELVHFSRTPQWINPVPDFPYSEAERQAFRDDPAKIEALRNGEQYWAGVREFNRAITHPDSPEMAAIETRVLRNLEENVTDPILREKLRPTYRAACKRLVSSPDYYAHAQRPNVTIEVGTIAQVEKDGIRMADGTFHPLDVIVLATGFRADRFVRPIHVIGENGIDLDDVWAVRPSAYLAVSIPHFPNFFLLNGPTGPVGNFSLIDIAEREWAFIDQLLEPIRSGNYGAVAASQAAFDDYEKRRIAAARTTIWGSGCVSWYLDSEGVPSSWPWEYSRFAEAMTKPIVEDFVYS